MLKHSLDFLQAAVVQRRRLPAAVPLVVWPVVAAIWLANSTADAAFQRMSLVVGIGVATTNDSFCTSDGQISVEHDGSQDPSGIGYTLLTGATTYKLKLGPAMVEKGCYTHTLSDTTVVGKAEATSIVLYN
jgi:hypothetical protein